MVPIASILVLAIIVIFVIVCVVVIGLSKNTALKIGLGIALFVVAMLMFGSTLVVYRSTPTVHQFAQPAEIHVPPAVTAVSPPVPPPATALPTISAWGPEVEEQLTPMGPYTTVNGACKRTGNDIVEMFRQDTFGVEADKIPKTLILVVEREEWVPEATMIQSVLESELPDLDVSIHTGLPMPRTEGVTVRLSINQYGSNTQLTATYRSSKGTDHIYARYSGKAWVSKFENLTAEFRTNHMVVRSPRLASTRQEAKHATEQEVRQAYRQMGRSSEWIMYAFSEGDVIVDQYEQELEGSSGSVWRMAYLIDKSAEYYAKINRVLQDANKVVAVVRESETRENRSFVASVALLILLVVGLYGLMNALTRGYYRGRISIALFFIVLGGLALLFA